MVFTMHMRIRKLGILSSIVSISVFMLTSIVFAKQEIESCMNYYLAYDYLKAIEIGKKAVVLNPNNFYAHFCLGASYLAAGNFDFSIREMRKAERIAPSRDLLKGVYNRLGIAYENKGDIENAFLYYNRYLSLARQLGDKKEEATALNNLANIYSKKGEDDKALNYLDEALQNEREESKSATYNDIAMIYSKRGNYQEAIKYLQKAIDIDKRYGNYHNLARMLINLGNIYRETKDFIQAEQYLNDGLVKIIKIGDRDWEATAYKFLGLYYEDIHNVQKSKEYFTKAYSLFKAIGAQEEAERISLLLKELENIK